MATSAVLQDSGNSSLSCPKLILESRKIIVKIVGESFSALSSFNIVARLGYGD